MITYLAEILSKACPERNKGAITADFFFVIYTQKYRLPWVPTLPNKSSLRQCVHEYKLHWLHACSSSVTPQTVKPESGWQPGANIQIMGTFKTIPLEAPLAIV